MANGSSWQTAANRFMGAPMMNLGLSLLAAGSDDRINPWAAAQQGLNTGMQQLQAQDMMDMRRQDMDLRQQAADRQTAAQDAVYDLFGYDPESGQLTPGPSGGPQYANAALATAGTIPGVSGGSGTLSGPLQAATQAGAPRMNPLLASMGITPEQAPAMARVMGSNPQMLQSLLVERMNRQPSQRRIVTYRGQPYFEDGTPVISGSTPVDPKLLSEEAFKQQQALREASRSPTNINVDTGDRGPQLGSIPAGWMLTGDAQSGYQMVPVPGGPAALEQQAAAEASEAAEEGQQRSSDLMLDEIQRSLDLVNSGGFFPTTGTVGGLLSNIAETDAGALRARLQTIRANIGFDRLQQMREASPTGGALGNVTEGELARLESVMGNLEQSQRQEDFVYNLERLQETYLDTIHGTGNRPDVSEEEAPTENRFEGMSEGDLLSMDVSNLSDAELANWNEAMTTAGY